MMDTDAIYSAVLDYGAAKRARFSSDEELDHRDRVKRLLNEADAERQELLATNEKLVDEVTELRQENQRLAQAVRWESDLCQQALESRKELEAENAELKAKLTDKASLLRGCYARINVLEKALRELHDATQLISVGNYDQEAHDIAVSRAIAALEKKHEGT